MELPAWPQKLQRLSGRSELGQSRNSTNSFVLIEDGSDKNAKLGAHELLLMFQMHVKGSEKRKRACFGTLNGNDPCA